MFTNYMVTNITFGSAHRMITIQANLQKSLTDSNWGNRTQTIIHIDEENADRYKANLETNIKRSPPIKETLDRLQTANQMTKRIIKIIKDPANIVNTINIYSLSYYEIVNKIT